MANTWLRLWHDMPNDPKWRTIAKASKRTISEVMAVYVHLLTNASANATERGRTHCVCSEDIASALDMETEQVDAILMAMEGRVLDQGLLTGWAKRQPEKEDGAAERARLWREKKKQEKEQNEEEERNRTQPNAKERPDKDTDKENIQPSSPPKAAPCKTQEIIDLFAECCPSLIQPKVIPDSVKAKIADRWRQSPKHQALEFWRKYFAYCESLDFLTGRATSARGEKPFRVGLEWIVKAENFAKIINGNYSNE
jgi:hypothetical protein